MSGWSYYNTQRPHQIAGDDRPRRSGSGTPVSTPVVVQRAADRSGDDWVSRRVGANGVVCVSWQQVSVGKHHAGARCDVQVSDELLQFWIGNELCKTVARASRGEVRKKRASIPRLDSPECQGSTEENPSSINRSWTSAPSPASPTHGRTIWTPPAASRTMTR